MKVSRKLVSIFVTTGVVLSSMSVFSQKSQSDLADDYNVVKHAVPFLVIAPDSRSGALGEQGAATEPDVWSMHWNPAKYSFTKKDFGVGFSYTPWLQNLGVKDVFQAYAAGYAKVDKFQTVAASFQYFNLGNVYFTNQDGDLTGVTWSPREFAVDVAYSRLLSKKFSFSIALRYIYSNLTGGVSSTPGESAHAAQTFASDISGYYQTKKTLAGLQSDLRFGFNISNLGGKMSYSTSGRKDFLPAMLRVAGGSTFKLDEFNDLGVNVEASKLLVQTPRYKYTDTTTNTDAYQGGENPDASLVQSVFNSFGDAPGGSKEEWHEVMWSLGLEYWYVKQFALRAGYFYENQTKGNRQFYTVGLGLKMSVIGIDAAYIIPTAGSNSPIANTWRLALSFDFDKARPQSQPQVPQSK